VPIDADALARDAAAVVQVPSVTGDERAALERLGEIAAELGLELRLDRHDPRALAGRPGHPGQEVPRAALYGLTVTVPGAGAGRRLCLNGHIDVVAPGTQPWKHGPWSGAIVDGRLHGRGAVDMKAAVVSALHALAAAGPHARCETVLMVVASEEDGGLGTFAALERDARFDACLIPEPTGFDVVCAQAGALTFSGEVGGRAAHAAVRLEGRSAIDAYLEVHAELAAHERRVNAQVTDPLMAPLELPYPLSVGRLQSGAWSSSVPDRATFEGRVGVPIGQTLEAAADGLRAALAGHPVELCFEGARFAPGRTDPADPFVALVREAYSQATGHAARAVGVSYGADMRLFCERGIPCVMAGTRGLERAHAVDEQVRVQDLVKLAHAIAGVIGRFH